MSKVFIGGLSWNTNEQTLREGFEKFGRVTNVKIVTDRDSGRSKGYGFVTFEDSEGSEAAITQMDGKPFDGRTITVNEAKERSR